MEKVYKYYEIAAFLTECALILCLKTCFYIKGFELINPENCVDLRYIKV